MPKKKVQKILNESDAALDFVLLCPKYKNFMAREGIQVSFSIQKSLIKSSRAIEMIGSHAIEKLRQLVVEQMVIKSQEEKKKLKYAPAKKQKRSKP